jgi:hypothetical protein
MHLLRAIDNGVDGGVPYAVGWLHFFHVDGLQIEGNTFINTDGHDARVLGLYTFSTATLMSDVNVLVPVKKSYTSLPCKNITVKNNKIKGFSHQNSSRLVYLQGRLTGSTKYYIENFRFQDNDVSECFAYISTYNACSDPIYAEYVKGLRISGNKLKNVRRLLYATQSTKVRVRENDIQSAYWVPITSDNCSDMQVVGNSFDGCGSAVYSNLNSKMLVEGNTVVNDINSAISSYTSIFAFKTCTRFFVKNNDLDGVSGTGYQSINIYTTSDKGKVADTWITNFTAASFSGDSTNITIS